LHFGVAIIRFYRNIEFHSALFITETLARTLQVSDFSRRLALTSNFQVTIIVFGIFFNLLEHFGGKHFYQYDGALYTRILATAKIHNTELKIEKWERGIFTEIVKCLR